MPLPTHARLSRLDRLFLFGWAGVDLFFVLSGFLITGILLDSKEKPHYFRNFYARRALRIWPIYYGLLVFRFILLPVVFSTPGLIEAIHNWPIYLAYLQNVWFHQGIPYNPLVHTWSLAMEEQFYLLWPIVVFFLPRRAIRQTLLLMLVVPLALRLTGNALGWGFQFRDCRFDSIAMGAYAAWWVRSPSCSWLRLKTVGITAVLIGLLSSIVSLTLERRLVFTYSFLALLFMGCLMLSLSYDFAVFRLRVLRYVGKISYGLYVYHVPVFSFTYHVMRRWHSDQLRSIIFEFAVSFAVAALSWHVFESPILRLNARFCD